MAELYPDRRFGRVRITHLQIASGVQRLDSVHVLVGDEIVAELPVRRVDVLTRCDDVSVVELEVVRFEQVTRQLDMLGSEPVTAEA